MSQTPEPHLPWLDQIGQRPWLLHVGSCIARKRIDVLLDVLAAVRKSVPDIRLVKVGGVWSDDQKRQIDQHRLQETITHVTGLSREELAVLYRRADAVLIPSEAEGFGLPVIEALACGGTVVISDIPVLREVGGPASIHCPVNNVEAWTETVTNILVGSAVLPVLATRLAWAEQFSWQTHANTISRAYQELILC
jgi:glycosyltransferase involved in cell wall biosynthesis